MTQLVRRTAHAAVRHQIVHPVIVHDVASVQLSAPDFLLLLAFLAVLAMFMVALYSHAKVEISLFGITIKMTLPRRP